MATYTIPLQPVASQQFTCSLNGEKCTFWVRQLDSGVYLDLTVNGSPQILGALCLNGTDLIRSVTGTLTGLLFFTDTEGNSDPEYTGLGMRYLLKYSDGAE